MDLQEDSELQHLYQLSRNQISAIVFLDDEAKIIKSILNKQYPSMIQDTHINRVQLICNQLALLNLVKSNVANDSAIHNENLNSTINNKISKSTDLLKLESERIEAEIKDLNKCFKSLKKQLLSFKKSTHATKD